MDFNEHCGLVIVGLKDDGFVIGLEVEERHLNRYGHVHGGVLFTMLDTAMSRAFFDTLPVERNRGVTLEMKINYLKAVKDGRLVATGWLVNATRRTAYVEGHIKNAVGELIAKATGTMYLAAPG